MAENEDKVTERHAQIIAFDDNMSPVENLKCERVIGEHTIGSIWFAKKNRSMRFFAQYNVEEVGAKRIEGDPCNVCWAAGKVWEDETVPKYVFCGLSGFEDPVSFLNTVFEPGEPIKVGVYMLEQENAPNCTYEYLDATKEIIWTPDDVLSALVVKTKPDNIVRMNASAGGCFRIFHEDHRLAEIKCC